MTANPRILFIGGRGHHYLRTLLPDHATGACLRDPHDPSASADWARRHEVDLIDGDFAAALKAFRPDVVSVGVVYNHNGSFVEQALAAGLPTISDKPLAQDAATLQRIEALATAAGAPPLLTEYDWRNRASLRAARAAVEAGEIGPVVLAVAQKSYRFGERPSWYADRQHYCGTLMWVACHGIDALAFVSGGQPTPRYVVGGNVSRPAFGTMEDHVVATLGLTSGGSGVVHADLLNPAASPTHGKDRLRIVGGRGELLVEHDRCHLTTDADPPRDITERAGGDPPLASRLLAALRGDADPDYHTDHSLTTARLMLACRDLQLNSSPSDQP